MAVRIWVAQISTIHNKGRQYVPGRLYVHCGGLLQKISKDLDPTQGRGVGWDLGSGYNYTGYEYQLSPALFART